MVRFGTFYEASLFASMKRADGYFAEVIHQNAGHLWGGAVAEGFPVVVSDEVIPDEAWENAPTRSDRLSEPAMIIAMLGLCGMALSVLFILLGVFFFILGSMVTFQGMPVRMQVVSIASLVCMIATFWAMLCLTRIYNRPNHPLHRLSRLVFKVIVWLLIIVA